MILRINVYFCNFCCHVVS